MARRIQALLKDALGEDLRWTGLLARLGDLPVVRVRVLEWQVVPREHIVLQVHWHEGRLQDCLKLLRHVLPVLTDDGLLLLLLTVGLCDFRLAWITAV